MIVLLDTSTPVCKITYCYQGNKNLVEWQADRTLATELLGRLQQGLGDYGKDFKDITGLGIFRGPGSFTGLRIGITVFNTIADSENVPIVGGSGDDWQAEVIDRLEAGQNDALVQPLYGSEAHITSPRK